MLPTRPSSSSAPDIARITLAVLVLGLLVAVCLWILTPFLGAIVWATMIVVSTWPAMARLQARLGGRRWLAIALLTATMLLMLVVPLVVAAATIVDHVDDITDVVRRASTVTIPPPPDWLHRIPAVGARLTVQWQQLADTAHDDLVALAVPYAHAAIQWFASQIGGLGLLVLHFLITVLVTVVLYATGEDAARGIQRFARRLAGERGERAVDLAGRAIRAVALGILGTATVQSVVAGLGLALCGVPYAAVFTAIIFVLCMVQLGPIPVMAPAVGWLYWSGHGGWGTVLLVWTVVVGTIDNVLRPMLIKRGADLPLPLIFAGAIGGLVGFGVIGLFVGPVVLAVTYRLLEWWVADIDQAPVDETAV